MLHDQGAAHSSMPLHKKITDRIQHAIDQHLFPACVVGVIRTHGERMVLPFGRLTDEMTSPRVQENTLFDIASLTKCIPTSSLALHLIDEGKLQLNDKLIAFIPELRNSYREAITIKHLLTQTIDYGVRLSSLKDHSADDILNILFTSELKHPPGTAFCYTNAASILLGIVIERVAGEPLDRFAQRLFFTPLGMTRTTFRPLEQFAKEEIVPTEIQEWRGGLVHGKVHDESAFILQQKMIPGSAGLFSTVPDLLTFLEMFLNNGVLRGTRYFSEEMLREMQTNQLAEIGVSAGLGWELNQPQFMGSHSTLQTFGKTGFTGCVCVVDIPRGVAFVILSNYTYPRRKADASAINALRRDIANCVFTHAEPLA